MSGLNYFLRRMDSDVLNRKFINALNKCSEKYLLLCDKTYDQSRNVDLLYNRFNENRNGYKGYWLWDKIKINYSIPYYSAPIIETRMSKNMLSKINIYATQNNSLFYIESLIPTISIKNHLLYLTPELNNP